MTDPTNQGILSENGQREKEQHLCMSFTHDAATRAATQGPAETAHLFCTQLWWNWYQAPKNPEKGKISLL